MDLALELGMTAAGLSRSMSERELIEWQHYAARRMLPHRKTHMLLAQIALWVARVAGAKDVTLSDFMLDPIDQVEDAEISADDVAAFFGGTVIRTTTEQ